MSSGSRVSRRHFLQAIGLASAAGFIPRLRGSKLGLVASSPAGNSISLQQFEYGDVSLDSAIHEQQLQQTQAVLMGLSDDSLLKPFRLMIGQPAPGEDLGGWYRYDPNYDWHTFDAGFAPTATFGQWVSALARMYAINRSPEVRERVLHLNRLYAKTIDGKFYTNNRFPAYCYDKLLLGLIDSHRLV